LSFVAETKKGTTYIKDGNETMLCCTCYYVDQSALACDIYCSCSCL